MQIQTHSFSFVPRRSPAAGPQTGTCPAESFVGATKDDNSGLPVRVQSDLGEKLKGGLLLGGLAAAGAALGVYAGMNTGFLAGLAGAAAGASGGAVLAAHATRSQNIKMGAVAGMLGGALLGASVAHPAAAVALGLSGASVPYGGLLAIFSSIE